MESLLIILVVAFLIIGALGLMGEQDWERRRRLQRQRKRSETQRAAQAENHAKTARRLRELAKLRDDGLLTDEEYDSKRKQLLEKL